MSWPGGTHPGRCWGAFELEEANLFDLLKADLQVDSDCLWMRVQLPEGPELTKVATAVASRIVGVRCVNTRFVQVWDKARSGAKEPSDEDRDGLRAFIEPGFGSPQRPISEDHVQGMLAEYLWYLLTLDNPDESPQLVRVERPGWTASSGGADGLTVLKTDLGLAFFLWEIKKHTAKRPLSATVGRAYAQLTRNALRYLAQLTAVAAERTKDEDEVRILYARLVDSWQKEQQEAGVGVAVATSVQDVPTKCFSTMKRHFPQLAPRIRGLVVGLGSYSAFTDMVRESLWTAR